MLYIMLKYLKHQQHYVSESLFFFLLAAFSFQLDSLPLLLAPPSLLLLLLLLCLVGLSWHRLGERPEPSAVRAGKETAETLRRDADERAALPAASFVGRNSRPASQLFQSGRPASQLG